MGNVAQVFTSRIQDYENQACSNRRAKSNQLTWRKQCKKRTEASFRKRVCSRGQGRGSVQGISTAFLGQFDAGWYRTFVQWLMLPILVTELKDLGDANIF